MSCQFARHKLFQDDIAQPQTGDFENFFECGFNFLLGRILQPLRKPGEDGLFLGLPRANDKWKTESRAISGVLLLKKSDLFRRELVQAGGCLFALRC